MAIDRSATLKWLSDRSYGEGAITVAADRFEEGSLVRTFLDLADQPIPARPPKPPLATM